MARCAAQWLRACTSCSARASSSGVVARRRIMRFLFLHEPRSTDGAAEGAEDVLAAAGVGVAFEGALAGAGAGLDAGAAEAECEEECEADELGAAGLLPPEPPTTSSFVAAVPQKLMRRLACGRLGGGFTNKAAYAHVFSLALDLDLVVVKDVERRRARARVAASTLAVATIVVAVKSRQSELQVSTEVQQHDIPEGRWHIQRMAVQSRLSQILLDNGLDHDTYGAMRLMSVDEPLPGAVGLTRVISMSVQPSPLKPHEPSDRV